jgi:uncharacterized repeat protein (TIGR02543 family)
MKKILTLVVAFAFITIAFASTTLAATQTIEVALTYENLPLEIHAGDKLIMDSNADGGNTGSILYSEQLINSEYETSKWGLSSTDDYFKVYYNDTSFNFSTGTTQVLADAFEDDWISWTVSGNTGTLEFLQDWPYAIDSMYSVNGATYTAKTAYSYGDNISLYAHLELTSEIPDYTLASDLGLEVSINGSALEVDDYFKFVERNGYYQLVSNVDDQLNYEKIYDDNYYVNLFSLLNNGTSSLKINFGDDSTLYDYQLLEISSGTSGVNPTVIQFEGTSIAPEIIINDLGDNVRQYNIYDDEILDASYSSGYNQVSKFIALLIEIPDADAQIATVNFFVQGALLSSNQFMIEDVADGGGGSSTPSNTIAAPTDPTLTDYIFLGWYDANDVLWDFSANPVESDEVNLYAKFVSDDTTIHSVFFEEGLGSALDDRRVIDGEALDQPSDPLLLGHELTHWYLDEDLTQIYDFSTVVTTDLTLYAGYEIGDYTITFDTNGGTDVTSITAAYQASISRPANPTRSGYNFAGWYTDEDLTDAFSFNTMPGYDLTLHAKWSTTSGGGIVLPDGGSLTTVHYVIIGIFVIAIAYSGIVYIKKHN